MTVEVLRLRGIWRSARLDELVQCGVSFAGQPNPAPDSIMGYSLGMMEKSGWLVFLRNAGFVTASFELL